MTAEEARRLRDLFHVDPFAPADHRKLYWEIAKVFGEIALRLEREANN